MGRSGTMWAIEQEGVTPDIITAGKGIASGLPLGAMIARDDVMTLGARRARLHLRRLAGPVRRGARDLRRDRGRGTHGERVARWARSSWPACATIARAASDHHARCEAAPCGSDCRSPITIRRSAVEQASFRAGLLALGCGDDAIRISPPLVFREDQARAALEIFEDAVAEVEAGGVGARDLARRDASRSTAATREPVAEFWCAALGYRARRRGRPRAPGSTTRAVAAGRCCSWSCPRASR